MAAQLVGVLGRVVEGGARAPEGRHRPGRGRGGHGPLVAGMAGGWRCRRRGRPAHGAGDRVGQHSPWSGYVLGRQSWRALAVGDLASAVRLARSAREPRWGLSPGGVGWSAEHEARAPCSPATTEPWPGRSTSPRTRSALPAARPSPTWLYWLADRQPRRAGRGAAAARGPDAAPAMEAAIARRPTEQARDNAWFWADDRLGAGPGRRRYRRGPRRRDGRPPGGGLGRRLRRRRTGPSGPPAAPPAAAGGPRRPRAAGRLSGPAGPSVPRHRRHLTASGQGVRRMCLLRGWRAKPHLLPAVAPSRNR